MQGEHLRHQRPAVLASGHPQRQRLPAQQSALVGQIPADTGVQPVFTECIPGVDPLSGGEVKRVALQLSGVGQAIVFQHQAARAQQ
ncbi:hypothetical protein [Kosakonia oryzendophytica]|uniref:hypothetical protein n=1 Tax=Kosakonia oryzendophytica TaxID=1005665 RepID=UPI001428D174|nr:hypothetical protein [Kosakonia oryzendophytica]